MSGQLEWKACSPAGQCPSKRMGASLALVGSTAYLFGGSLAGDETVYFNDMHSLYLNTESLEWVRVEPKGVLPCRREGHALVESGGFLYLFGGFDASDADICLPGVYSFDPTDGGEFETLSTDGEEPKALNSSTASIRQCLYVFGGIVEGAATNTLHMFHIDTKKWTLLNASGEIPEARGDHSCASSGTKLFVFGGSLGENSFLNSLYCLETATLTWSKLLPPENPHQREFSSLCSHGLKNLYLFGGTNMVDETEMAFNDVHRFDLDETTWTLVSTGDEVPEVRFGHAATCWRNQMLVFGGMNNENDFADLWILTLPSDGDVSSFKPTASLTAHYDLSAPIPAPRRRVPVPAPKAVPARGFEEQKTKLTKQIAEMYDELRDKFLQLDKEKEKLRVEREAFEEEKTGYEELYLKQQKELKEMFEQHKIQNEEWIHKMRKENDKEKKWIAEEKARWEAAHEKLTKEREIFDQKSTKIDALMKQFQGISS
ncbi:rab9 effector protein with kelch motifs-like [Oscarella lobularis]|uniref:rab9 effector protein with kelch motifs-like n=1 Tax=Oscarella lobularis TaxID=121494 RepID=UPI0033133E04